MAKRSCRARWGELASKLPASAGIKVFSGSVALSLLADSCERGQAQSQLPRWLESCGFHDPASAVDRNCPGCVSDGWL